ncbi:glutamate mutase L [Lentzea sp. NPDC059081]|uniref:glutamate mutase L n=1 Tax=Lentzea sp. NPDC059081 TaxID=3346719 RepID=UPI0036C3D401
MSREPTLLALEVGSTYTKLVAFTDGPDGLRIAGRAAARTTVDAGDVGIGVGEVLASARDFGITGWDDAVLTSSAAGGLRIAVCGLTPTLSTKVGTEIALGAGGVVVASTSGRIDAGDLATIARSRPGLVLVCGGTDHGEVETVLANAAALAESDVDSVFVFAGNARVRDEVEALFAGVGKHCVLADNVYPESDCFRFTEVRDLIRGIYERDVVKAPGIDAVRERLGSGCVPTPLAVSRAVEALAERFGGLLALDVGGATTDVHSWHADRQDEGVVRATFEPRLKRTVEGDLGVFHNLPNLLEPGEEPHGGDPILDADRVRGYALRAVRRGLARHCGHAVRVHGAAGVRHVVHGADLRQVDAVLATGGALSHGLGDPGPLEVAITGLRATRLVPENVRTWLVDRKYVVSALGALLPRHPTAVGRFVERGMDMGDWC